jgi:hypothetical protein
MAMTEEATKTSVILPFIRALGFDVFSLDEVVPEFTADVGTKKGEKVDFAIKINGNIVILIEAKPISMSLGTNQHSQLYRYFAVTDARIGLLTNGKEFQFYSDTEQKNLERGKNYDVNFDIANHEAFFMEGEDSLMRYLYKRINISKEAVESKLSLNAMLGFQVNFDGKVQQVYSISKVGFGIDEQLISELGKVNFVPASQGSLPYRSEVVLEIPINSKQISEFNTGTGE